MTYRKIKSLSELEDGWYWWRSESYDKAAGGIYYVFDDLYRDGTGRWRNHDGGEWAGPILMPEHLEGLLMTALVIGNEIGPEAMPADVWNEWNKKYYRSQPNER